MGDSLPIHLAHGVHLLRGLTRRRREVALLYAGGFAAAAIAHRLGIREATVRTHVNGIHDVLRTDSAARVCAMAYEALFEYRAAKGRLPELRPSLQRLKDALPPPNDPGRNQQRL